MDGVWCARDGRKARPGAGRPEAAMLALTSESLRLARVSLAASARARLSAVPNVVTAGSTCAGGDEVVFRRRQMAGEVGEVRGWLSVG
jgi:hypothetical protein